MKFLERESWGLGQLRNPAGGGGGSFHDGRGNAAAGTKIGILTVGWLAPMEALEHLTAMGVSCMGRCQYPLWLPRLIPLVLRCSWR